MLWLESERKYHNEHILSHPYFSGCPLSTINQWSFQYTVWLTMSFYLYQFQSDHPWISASPHRCYHRRTWRTGSSESASSEMAAADMHVWNGCLPIWRSPMLPVLLVSLYPNMWLALLLHCIDHFQFIHIIRQLTLGFHLTIVARFTKKQSWFSAPETSVLPLPTV